MEQPRPLKIDIFIFNPVFANGSEIYVKDNNMYLIIFDVIKDKQNASKIDKG